MDKSAEGALEVDAETISNNYDAYSESNDVILCAA